MSIQFMSKFIHSFLLMPCRCRVTVGGKILFKGCWDLKSLVLTVSAIATPLLGTEQCARGPPYWCQNVKTASMCGAVTHCQQNVWSKPQMVRHFSVSLFFLIWYWNKWMKSSCVFLYGRCLCSHLVNFVVPESCPLWLVQRDSDSGGPDIEGECYWGKIKKKQLNIEIHSVIISHSLIDLWNRCVHFWQMQSEILSYLEKACQIIPDESLAAECKEMVDNYYPVIMGIIKGELVSVIPMPVTVFIWYSLTYQFS